MEDEYRCCAKPASHLLLSWQKVWMLFTESVGLIYVTWRSSQRLRRHDSCVSSWWSFFLLTASRDPHHLILDSVMCPWGQRKVCIRMKLRFKASTFGSTGSASTMTGASTLWKRSFIMLWFMILNWTLCCWFPMKCVKDFFVNHLSLTKRVSNIDVLWEHLMDVKYKQDTVRRILMINENTFDPSL